MQKRSNQSVNPDTRGATARRAQALGGAPAVGIIGTIQATETIKVLLNIGTSLQGRLLLLDAAAMEWRSIKLRKDPACPVCG